MAKTKCRRVNKLPQEAQRKIAETVAAQAVPWLEDAIAEQRCRVEHLRALIKCFGESTDQGTCTDPLGAMYGLLDLTDSIDERLELMAERAKRQAE